MRTLTEYYKFLLREEFTPEAPSDAEFGQFAFAPTRQDVPKPKEPNTEEENKVRAAIADYLLNNKKKALSGKANLLLGLIKKGLYKKVLDPSQYSKAWRLMRMAPKDLAAILARSEHELGTHGVAGPGMLSPHESRISGWTTNPTSLLEELPNFGSGRAFAIFVAPIKGNKFFGNPGEVANALGMPELAPEMETIAIDTVRYEQCSYAIMTLETYADQVKRMVVMKNVLSKIA